MKHGEYIAWGTYSVGLINMFQKHNTLNNTKACLYKLHMQGTLALLKIKVIRTSNEFDGCFCHDDDNVYVQFDQ